MKNFETINKGYNDVFKPQEISIGLVAPLAHYTKRSIPTMNAHLERIQLAEQLGFKAIWLRDIPAQIPSFGDAGQMYDPFTYLGFLAGQTSTIAMGIASIALPLHHPIHLAKAAATVDLLSDGRIILGIASGDRYDEYPAMGITYTKRGELFREAYSYIRAAQEDFPILQTQHFGELKGNVDILPKPKGKKIPLLITGYSQQSLEWNAEHADGWMSYPKNLQEQQYTLLEWRKIVHSIKGHDKPFLMPIYIDLHKQDDFKPAPIHLGFRIGANYLIDYIHQLKSIGVNHLALNLRYNSEKIPATLERLADKVLPQFHSTKK